MNALLPRLIRLIWFVALSLAFGLPFSILASELSPVLVSFACNEHNQARVAYDGVSFSAFDYDSASVVEAFKCMSRT